MGMQCNAHQKSFVGPCQMCGKDLCKLCVSRIKGIRIWCTGCSSKLDKFPELTVHTPRKEMDVRRDADAEWYEIPAQPKKLPERPYTAKFGYFDFASLAKNRGQ